jgi:HAD superfamily hydrolase (TIGR01490 family)
VTRRAGPGREPGRRATPASAGRGRRGARASRPVTKAAERDARPDRPTGVAFFDFDNTLIHGDAGPLFGRSLVQARLHSRSWLGRLRLRARYLPYILWMALQAALYKVRARRRSSLVRSAYRGLKGVPVAQFDGLLEEFVDAEIPRRIYPELRRHVEEHLAAGRRCVIVTTGMEPLVRRALRHLPEGMEVIGCRMLHRKGKLTGRVVGPLFGVDKANILDAYARAIGVPPADCWAYSDHGSDRQMLEAVGHGVAVNPKGRFRKLARRNGWAVLEPAPRD